VTSPRGIAAQARVESLPAGEAIAVYRFKRTDGIREICPQHMWGTREAVAALGGCVLLEETARKVASSELEGGFFYDIPESASIKIDAPQMPD
jgi:hypothetical protein